MKKTVGLLTILVGLGLNISSSLAQSIVTDGTTTTIVTPNGNRFDITGETFSRDGKNLFHSFEKFGLDANQIANFLSNPNVINILTRVTGGNASVINGLIGVSGGNSNLFIMNPAGIIFGSGASLNVPADFTATTATGISFDSGWFNAIGTNDYASLVGNPTGFQFSGNQPGTIINGGNLTVSPGQNLALMSGAVINTGTINAPGGTITVTAVGQGGRVRISQEGQLLSLEVDAPTDEQGNILPFTVKDVPALLTGNPVDTKLEVTPNGQVQIAQSQTIIPTAPGTTVLSGNVSAANLAANALGGEITVTGDRVGLVDVSVDASGTNGGGTVLIGGERQGTGTIPKSQDTSINANSAVHADAITEGNGGQIVVWSDGSGNIEGLLTAKGGTNGGNGGFIETSAKEFVNLTPTIDASAFNGQPGIWLIDPTDVIIDPDLAASISFSLSNGTDITITTADTISGSDQGNITQPAGSNITVTDLEGNNTVTLTYIADNNIDIRGNITATGKQLNLDFTAGGTGGIAGEPNNIGISIVNATINTNGGFITFDGTAPNVGTNANDGIYIQNSNLNSGGGDITFNGTGGAGISLNDGIYIENSSLNSGGGTINFTGVANTTTTGENNQGIEIQNSSTINSGGGDITFNGTGGAGTNTNDGINLGNGSSVNSSGGVITFTGVGSSTSTGEINRGIAIEQESTINSGDGDIIFNGTGGAGSNNNDGISIVQSSNLNSGEGEINFTATGGTGTNSDGILMASSSSVNSEGGDINFTGTGGLGSDNNDGISIVESSNLNSGGGEINFTATGGTGSRSDGILISSSSSLNSQGGEINFTATGGTGTDNNNSILVQSSSINSTGGAINFTGVGSPTATGEFNRGINIQDNSSIDSGGGAITFNGTGGAGTNRNSGIFLDNSVFDSRGGTINFTGAGSLTATGQDNRGINIQGILTINSGGAVINFNGTGGSGTNNNIGIFLGGSSCGCSLNFTGGDINFIGIGGTTATGQDNRGINIQDNSTINSNGRNITFDGTGGAGTNSNMGIFLGTSSSLNSSGGTINFTGVGSTTATGQDNRGINIQDNSPINSGGGNIIFNGTGGSGSSGNYAISLFDSTISAGTGNITLLGSSRNPSEGINLFGTSKIISVNDLTVNGNSDLNLTIPSFLGNLNIAMSGDVIISTDTGTISTGGADVNVEGASVTTPNIDSSGLSEGAIDGGSVTITATSGDISTGNIDSTGGTFGGIGGDVTLNATGAINTLAINSFGGGSPEIAAGGEIFLTGSTITTGNLLTSFNNITFDGPVILIQDTIISNTVEGANESGAITFNGTVNSESNSQTETNFNLSVYAGTGNITFNGAVGNNQPLGQLDTISTQVIINSPEIKTTQAQTYSGEVIIDSDTILSGNSVIFENPVNSASGENNDLTLNVGSNDISLTQIGTTGAIGTLSVNSSGVSSFDGTVNAQNINTNAPGTTVINTGQITTSGNQTYNDPVTLPQNTTLNGTNVSFGSTVNGSSLQVNASGTTNFNGTVSLTGSLTTDAPGTTTINTSQVTTSGSQTYNDPVTLQQGTTVEGNNVTFGSTVNGSGSLQVNSSGTTRFNGTVNTGGTLTTDEAGNTVINTDQVTTGGSQTYGDSVTIEQNTTLNATGGINLNNTVDSAAGETNNLTLETGNNNANLNRIGTNQSIGELTVNSGGTTTFNEDVNVQSITTDAPGTTVINSQQVRTSGDQTYNDPVTLPQDTTVEGNNVTFGSTVNGSGSLQVNASGNTSLNGTVNLQGNLTTDGAGTTTINTAQVTTSGDQTYNDPVTLQQNTTVEANNVTFDSTVNGNDSLQVNATGTTRLNGTVNLQGDLTTDEPGNTVINTEQVTTAGSQNYGDAVTIEQNTTLSANGGITFNNTVDSAAGETNDLTLETGNNDVNLNQIGTNQSIGNLTVNSGGTTSFDGTVNAQSITTDAPGTTVISTGQVTTPGDQTYNDPVTLPQNTTVNANNVTFGSTVEGTGNLNINATGTTTLGGTVNLSGDLTTDAEGTTVITGSQITSNRQTYNDNVSINNNTNLSASEITFNQNLGLGTNSLTLTSDNLINLPPSGSGVVTSSSGSSLNFNTVTPSRSIVLGTSATGNSLQIRNLSQLQSANFSSLTFGVQNVTESVEVTEPITFSSPVTLQGKNIRVNQPITGIDDASVTINGSRTTTTLNADITTTGNPITINDNVLLGNNVTLSTTASNSSGSNITIDGTINSVTNPNNLTLNAGSGTVALTGAIGNTQPLNQLQVNSNNIIQLGGGLVTTTSDQTYSGNIQLGTNIIFNAGGNFSANAIAGQGTNVEIGASNITVNEQINTFSNLGTGGTITLNTPGTITTGNIISGSDLTSPGAGGNIQLTAEGNIVTSNIFSGSGGNLPGGNISIESSNGSVTTGLIVSGALNSTGGSVNISAPNNITTGPIFTGSLGLGNGGEINISSNGGFVNIDPSGVFPDALRTISANGQTLTLNGLNSSANLGNGGQVNIDAPLGINTQQINTSSRVGNGGNVTLSSVGDIQVTSINAQGGTNGTGGNVDITTNQFFRATDTFIDQNNINASISTSGGLGGGTITIRHGGGGVTSFVVGDANLPTNNGTAGEITNGNFNINTGDFPFTERRGNVAIISVPGPPIIEPPIIEPPINEPTPTPTPNNEINIPKNEQTVIPQVFQPEEPASIQQTATTSPTIAINTLSQTREILTYIERQTAEIPALIYIGFAPPGVVTQEVTNQDLANREANLTAQYQGFLNLNRQRTDTILSVIPEDDYELELILITKEGQPYRIQLPGVTRKQVVAAAESFYVEVANAGSDYKANAIQLYDWLLKPLAAELEAKKIDNVLFFMPTGLRLIPIAALYDQENEQFVVQKDYTVGLAPSLNLVDYRYRSLKDSPVLAFGASQFAESEDQNPLPAVNIELPLIAGEIRSGEYFINDQFTLNNVQRFRNQSPFPIVHFATHADFDLKDPSQSYIQLYNQKLRLTQWQQLDLELPTVDLMVISACNTAVGNPQIELGFGGMAVQAGVKTVIASLWYVGDTGTLGLMDQLYRQLKVAPIKADALQQAQRALLEQQVIKQGNQLITPQGNITLPDTVTAADEDLTHPYYWASFTLIGSPW